MKLDVISLSLSLSQVVGLFAGDLLGPCPDQKGAAGSGAAAEGERAAPAAQRGGQPAGPLVLCQGEDREGSCLCCRTHIP